MAASSDAERKTFTLPRRNILKRVVRKVGRRFLAWRFRAFTPESAPGRNVTVGGIHLQLSRGVFDPTLHFTSSFLASYIRKSGIITQGLSVLDLGTGSGIVAIAAALAGAGRVVATDINPEAVACARRNAEANSLAGLIVVRQGDMFEPCGEERYDLVLCNPPYFRGEPQSMAARAFLGGRSLEWVRRFGEGLRDHLLPGGSCIVSVGDAADIPEIVSIFEECGWECSVAAKRDILVEVIYLFRLARRG